MPTVKELRKAGKLDEALKLAQENLDTDSQNIWNIRAIAWVYYDYLKKYVNENSFEGCKDALIKIKELNLPEDENMLFDSCAWQIGSLIFHIYQEKEPNYPNVNQIFEIISDFHFSKPSEAYSFLYKAFHKGYKNWNEYLRFADWWGFENFREEDYQKEEFNGKFIMALVEQAYIAYSKKLLEGEVNDGSFSKIINKEKVRKFLLELDQIIKKYSDYQYPPYFKVKLQLAIGETSENTLSAFLPFAKKKRNDFWVWELLADIYKDNPDIQFACYCKALSLRTKEDFLVKLREDFVKILIEKKLYNEAKTEIKFIVETRRNNEWKLPDEIIDWGKQDWFKNAEIKNNNRDLYSKYCPIAEEVLFKDVIEEIIVVDNVNHNKEILNFIENQEKIGFFKYKGFIEKPKVGDILKVRFDGNGQDNFYKILSLKKVSNNTPTDVIKNFMGKLKIIPTKNFGFVDDVFIEPKIIEKHKLIDGETIKGKAMLSFNKKKNDWGWKVIEI